MLLHFCAVEVSCVFTNLALQVRYLPGKLGLWSVRHERVQRAGDLILTRLFVFELKSSNALSLKTLHTQLYSLILNDPHNLAYPIVDEEAMHQYILGSILNFIHTVHTAIRHSHRLLTCQPLWHAGSPVSRADDGREGWMPPSFQSLCIWTETDTQEHKRVHENLKGEIRCESIQRLVVQGQWVLLVGKGTRKFDTA